MNHSVEGDRLSCLPDDLIHKILSFVSIKCAIQTSFLSPRWRYVWTSMPYLKFCSVDFLTSQKFSKFVANVLSRRNNQLEVSSVELSFHGKVKKVFVKRIMNYIFSRNVQLLTLSFSCDDLSQFPLSLFSSQSLKHLIINFSDDMTFGFYITPMLALDLPALTTLYLSYVTLNDHSCLGLLSKYANLKNLTLNHFTSMGPKDFSICHPQLSNLTLENGPWMPTVVEVVAPKLENLTIINCSTKFTISAPGLFSLIYKGYRYLKMRADGFHSLEKVDLYFHCPFDADAHNVMHLLQQLHSAKFVTLNTEIVELLFSSAIVSHQPSPFANVKSLKIYPLYLFEELDIVTPTEVRNYLLDNCPCAAFTMVSRKEIMASKNSKLAQNLLEEVQVLLEEQKTNRQTNMDREMQAQHKQGKVGGRMKSYWEGLRLQIEQGETETCGILSKLSQIEGLLAKLPACERAEMQPTFSRMCAEADTIMNNIIDSKKINCDNKRRRLNVYSHELATTPQPSSQ